jgi:hypothetical protein
LAFLNQLQVLDLLPQLDPPALCSVAWSFAASGVANPDWWVGLSYEVLTRVSYDVPKDQQALLYEAFTAAAELAHVRLDDQAFSDLLEAYKSNWSPRRLEVSKKVNVAGLLKAMQEDFSQDVAVKGLYIMPYLLRRSAVIVCPVKSLLHPMSGQLRGEIAMCKMVWDAMGYHMILIPDDVWTGTEADDFDRLKREISHLRDSTRAKPGGASQAKPERAGRGQRRETREEYHERRAKKLSNA